MDHETEYGCRRGLLVTLGVILLVMTCSGVTVGALDILCHNIMTERLPLYAGAEITFENHSFIRSFGMGDTVIILESDEPSEVVREWYARTVAARKKDAREAGDMAFFSLSKTAVSVTSRADGTGSLIILSGSCVV